MTLIRSLLINSNNYGLTCDCTAHSMAVKNSSRFGGLLVFEVGVVVEVVDETFVNQEREGR